MKATCNLQPIARQCALLPRSATVCRRRGRHISTGHRQSLTATAAAVDTALAIVGSLGIVGGTFFAALYIIERQSKEVLHRKLERLEATIRERDQQLLSAAQEVDRAKEHARENDMFRVRYADASRDIFKLERALELKDGQLESFMVVAKRQIAYLESRVRDLHKAAD